MNRFRSFAAGWVVCFGLAAMLGMTGCGGSSGPATLGGDVKLDGAPLTAGNVKLTPSGGADTTERNTIIDNGHYYFASVPAGAVKLTVTGPGKSSGSNAPAPTVVVPAKYADVNQSGLTYTVKAGANNTYDISLTK